MYINILLLATVALFPFSYSVWIAYQTDQTAFLFFAGNVLASTLLLALHWLYATRNHHLMDKDIPDGKVRIMRNILLYGILHVLIAIGLSFYEVHVNKTLQMSGTIFGILSLIYLVLIVLLGKNFGKVKEKETS
jgi:uncharacterized membrane protein